MKYLPLLIVVLTLTACTESITYETALTHYTSEDYEICKTQQCPVIDLTIIELKQPERLKEIVNTWTQELTLQELNLLVEQDYEHIEDGIKEYLNTAQIGYPETSVLSDAHELTIDTALSFSSDNLLSVVFYSYQFSGGASGFDSVRYLNLNPQTGEEFTNEALFKETFFAFAKAKFEEKYPANTFDISNYSHTIEEIGFNQEGLLIIYNDGDALSLNSEIIQLLIPWEEAEDYVTF